MRTVRAFLLALLATITGLTCAATMAQAAPTTITFDNGRASLGFFRDRVVLPASGQFPSDDLPLPQRTDIQLNADLTDGVITVPQATNTGLQFPYMHVMHPLEPDLKIPVTLRLNQEGLTGTWDEASGAMTLEGPVDIIIVTGTGTTFPLPDSIDDLGVPPLGLFGRCRFDNVPMAFSTANKSPITAEPFTGGFGVNGAITTSWNKLEPAVSENGGTCEGDLNNLTTSSGGLWLSNGVVEPKPQPAPPGPTCKTDLSLCPDPKYTEIDSVKIRPGKKMVRRGQKVKFTVKVHNSGNAAARNVKVKIRTGNKGFRVPKFVKMTVPAGKTASKKFTVKIRRNAKGKGNITARKNGWSGSAFLKVRKK